MSKSQNQAHPSFGLSTSEAREFAGTLAATGRIGAEALGAATKAGKNLAIVLGTDSTQAAKTYAAALREPGKGITDLNALLGQWSSSTVQLVQSLDAQNQKLEAQKIIIDGVNQATEYHGGPVRLGQDHDRHWQYPFSDMEQFGESIARTLNIGKNLDFAGQIAKAR